MNQNTYPKFRKIDGALSAPSIIHVLCPYCGSEAVLTSSKEVYGGRDYGKIYLCRPCDAYVGVHKGTDRPLGTPANAELRELRKKAHAAFDPIWQHRLETKRAHDRSYTRYMARGGRYKALAELMGIPLKRCHIAMFGVQDCHQAIEICESGQLGPSPTKAAPEKTNV